MGAVVTKTHRNREIGEKTLECKQDGKESKTNEERSLSDCYEMLTLLGEGSFAQVYKANVLESHVGYMNDKFKIRIPNIVAIKRIEMVKGVTKEQVDLMKLCASEHVVEIFEMMENDSFYFLIMECVSGGDLFDYVINKNFLSEAEASDIIKQVAKGLHFMHQKCVVHRDVKPENIIFVENAAKPIVKITDLGLADKITEPGMASLTSACGTPGYVAPEVLKRLPYGEKVDVWSLGVILYILLCGYPPFYSDKQPELFSQIKSANYNFSEEYWGKISEDVKDTLTKIFVVDAENRLSMAQILQQPWINFSEKQSTEGLGDHVVEGLSDVQKDKRFKHVALALNAISAFKRESLNAKIAQKLKARRDSLE